MNTSAAPSSSADIIRQLEARMHELDVTHTALARLSGLSSRTLNAYLSGHSEISLRLLLRLAATLHLSLQLAPLAPVTGAGDPSRETATGPRIREHFSHRSPRRKNKNN